MNGMATKTVDWNQWFRDRSSGQESQARPKRERDPDRPPYRRGSGLKVVICHKEHEEAAYYRQLNRQSGNEVMEDDRGFLYCLVCRY